MERVIEPAVILQHPSAPIPMLTDPRHQSVDPAARPVDALPTRPAVAEDHDEQLHRIAGIDAVGRLVAEFGAASIARWVRYHAAMKGESL